MSYLYTFHIQNFFILPFLYGISTTPFTSEELSTMVIRLYWPYFIISTLFMICYGCFNNLSHTTFADIIRLYVICDNDTIKRLCGLQVLWFLPSMMSTMLLKELFYRNNKSVRTILLVLSFTYIICTVWSNTSYHANLQYKQIASNMPFGCGYALQILPLGVITRLVIEKMEQNKQYNRALIINVALFIIGSIVYGKYVATSIGYRDINVVNSVLQNTMPVVFCTILVSALHSTHKPRPHFISAVGANSLYIYLTSPFIGYLCYYVCLHFNFVSWWIGLILFPIITVIAYIISITFIRGRIKLLFFPRNLNDLKLSFKTTRTQ